MRKIDNNFCSVVENNLPEGVELEYCRQIRVACDKEIKALRLPNEAAYPEVVKNRDDIIGDIRICRFLRSKKKGAEYCQSDLDTAIEAFRSFLKYRVQDNYKVERIRATVVGKTPEEFLDWFHKRACVDLPICPYAGISRAGDMVMYICQGRADFYGMAKNLPNIDVLLGMLEWQLWKLDQLSRKQERVAYLIKIMDFKGIGEDNRGNPLFVSEVRNFIPSALKDMSVNYPDHDSSFIVLNSPWIFKPLFSLVSVALTARQKSKFHIVGNSSDLDVMRFLLERVGSAQLPIEYGGDLVEVRNVFPERSKAERDATRYELLGWEESD